MLFDASTCQKPFLVVSCAVRPTRPFKTEAGRLTALRSELDEVADRWGSAPVLEWFPYTVEPLEEMRGCTACTIGVLIKR